MDSRSGAAVSQHSFHAHLLKRRPNSNIQTRLTKVDTEREEIEQYMTTHALEMHLNQIVNDVVKEQPEE